MLVILAIPPSGIESGGNDTYTTSALVGAVADRTAPPLAHVVAGAGTGFETSRPAGGGGVGPTPSVHAPNRATQASVTIRRRTLRSARTAAPSRVAPMRRTSRGCLLTSPLPHSQTPPSVKRIRRRRRREQCPLCQRQRVAG